MTPVFLVAGGSAGERELAVARLLAGAEARDGICAVILEGVADQPLDFGASVAVVRLAPACPCCTGNLALRVTLNRLLRQSPAMLVVGIAQAEHIEALRQFLAQPPYQDRLTLRASLSI